jgi:hypothetical protein
MLIVTELDPISLFDSSGNPISIVDLLLSAPYPLIPKENVAF